MNDDLLERLQDHTRRYDDQITDKLDAVDRIEELEAKLAKAVEALDNVVVEYDLFRKYEYERGLSSLDDEIEDARTTLAELEGEK